MIAFLAAAILSAIVLYRLLRLERHSKQQDARIADLTRRIWELEGGTPAPELSDPGPQAAAPVARPRRDWEALIGANWLNRVGALVLVIGIALFLGFSLTQLGPAGKIAIGFVSGISLLTAGIAIESRPVYRAYSWSLMGAGWAIIYSTAFAMHGLPQARIVDSPLVGIGALAAVSAAMIAHAARYRSEFATTLAFLLALAGLHVHPLTAFAVAASALLAVALVVLSYRSGWMRLPLVGLAAVYLGFALREAEVVQAWSALWIYWLAFEAYDLAELRRERGSLPLFPLNVCGFIGASVLHGLHHRTSDWFPFLAASGAAFLVSAAFRARWQPAESRRGAGFEPAAIASATVFAAALLQRFTGISATIALTLEAEMVVLAGWRLGSRWLERAGAVLFLLPMFHLAVVDAPGTPHRTWTPTAAALGAVLAANRFAFGCGWYYAAGAASMFAAVIAAEAADVWVAPMIAAGSLALLWSGRRDLTWTGVAGLTDAWAHGAFVNIDKGEIPGTMTLVAALYGAFARWSHPARPAFAAFATSLLTLLVFDRVQGRLLTVTLGAEGAALLAAGFAFRERSLRLAGLVLFLLCVGKLFVYDLRELDTLSRILSFVVLGLLLMAASWLYTRYRDKLSRLI